MGDRERTESSCTLRALHAETTLRFTTRKRGGHAMMLLAVSCKGKCKTGAASPVKLPKMGSS